MGINKNLLYAFFYLAEILYNGVIMRISLKNKILIAIIGVLVILSLNFFQKEVKNIFYLISSPIQKGLWQIGERVSNFFETISEIKNLKKENKELKLKIQELLAENAALKELKKENKILRRALDIGLEKEFKLALAEVIGKNISQDSLIINRGFEDGISKGMPVITEQKTLVGKISQVYKNFSEVELSSNKNSSFDAKILNSDIQGIVKGKGNLKLFLEFIPQKKEIKEGASVVTTALGGIFPESLLVGEIKEIKKSDIKPFQQAEIEPAFDLEEIETLFIITNF
ncbi:MAG: rod shape-determining protein MreC [Patescibacteria group bacterium]|nr:rod shape-determining protein MreC [Patescibacteria group bacterium]